MLYPEITKLVKDFKRFLTLKRYSKSSVDTYSSIISSFFNSIKIDDYTKVNSKIIEKFLTRRVIDDKVSFSTQKQIVGSFKIFFNTFLNMNLEIYYLYPDRHEKKLPNVLSQNEVKAILSNTNNLKHKTLLTAIYASGLRMEEV